LAEERYFISLADFLGFLKRLATEYEIFVPSEKDGRFHLGRFVPEETDSLRLNPCRVVEPLKAFFFPPREKVAEYFAEGAEPEAKKRIIVGAKRCDVAALKILDFVFLQGDFEDPFYKSRRENTVIISSDCGTPVESCFCGMFDSNSYPVNGFDLNLSEVDDGFVVEVGSETGRKLTEGFDGFKEATQQQLEQRDNNRKEADAQIREKVGAAGLYPAEKAQGYLLAKMEDAMWARHAENCVECGACNFVCPTCHCFLLIDLEEAGKFKRFKDWDSCQYPAFARVAGGANPRKRRAERLRNRFEKKFDFFPRNMGSYACTGCGRCVDACPGKIDIRELLKELAT